MVSANPIFKIIRREPGPQTGETYYQTEDGIWWERIQFEEPYGTGDRYGNKTDGHIRENR